MTYSFAIRATNSNGNTSAISNIASVTIVEDGTEISDDGSLVIAPQFQRANNDSDSLDLAVLLPVVLAGALLLVVVFVFILCALRSNSGDLERKENSVEDLYRKRRPPSWSQLDEYPSFAPPPAPHWSPRRPVYPSYPPSNSYNSRPYLTMY